MAKLNDLIVTIGAQTKQFDKALGASMSKMRNFGRSTKQLGRNMTRSLTMPIAALGAAAIKSAADLEAMETSFISLTGGAKQAADMMRNLNQFAAKTPFQIEGIAKSARMLLAAGSDVSEVNDQLQFLGDIAATSQQPIDEIAAIFAKVNAKGKVELENLNQLAERGIGIFEALSEATGLPASELGAGRVSVEQFNAVLKAMTEEGGKSHGAMLALSQTASGKFSTALDNLKQAGAALAKSLMPVLKDILDRFVGLMQTLTNLSPQAKRFMLIGAGIAAALGPLLTILPFLVQGFMMLMSPITLIVAAIAGLGYAIITFADEIAVPVTAVINFFISLWNTVTDIWYFMKGAFKGAIAVVFEFFAFAIDMVIQNFLDLGKVITAVMRGDFASIPELISGAFTAAQDRMAEFGKKAAEEFTASIDNEMQREPTEFVTEESVAKAIGTFGGMTDKFKEMLAGVSLFGGGAGAGAAPTTADTTPAEVDTTLNIVDIEMDEDVVDEEDIDKVIAAADLVKRQTQAMAQAVGGFIEHTFNQVLSGTQTFSEVMQDMLKNLVKQIAVMIAQFVILNTLFGATGVGGLNLSGFIQKGFGIPMMANGGLFSGASLAMVGEGSGTSSINPEVVAPLDRLQEMMGATQVQVTGRISGRDILLTSERNAIDRNRVRGF
jgi:tape measure domain-containing protein